MPIESNESLYAEKILKLRRSIDFIIANEKPQIYLNKNGYPQRIEYRFDPDACNSPWQFCTRIPSIGCGYDDKEYELPKEDSTPDFTMLKTESSTSYQGWEINSSLKPSSSNLGQEGYSEDSSAKTSQFQFQRGQSLIKKPVAAVDVAKTSEMPKSKTIIGRNSSKVASNSACKSTDQNTQNINTKRSGQIKGERSAAVMQTATLTKNETRTGRNFGIANHHSEFKASEPKYKNGNNSTPKVNSNSVLQNQQRGVACSRRARSVSSHLQNVTSLPKNKAIIGAKKDLPKVASEEERQQRDLNSQSTSPKNTQLRPEVNRFGFSPIKSIQKCSSYHDPNENTDINVKKSGSRSSYDGAKKSSYEFGNCKKDVKEEAAGTSRDEKKNSLHEVADIDASSSQGKKKASRSPLHNVTRTVIGSTKDYDKVEYYLYAKNTKNKSYANNSNVNPVGHKSLKSAHEKLDKKPTTSGIVAKANNVLTEKKPTREISQECKRSIMDEKPKTAVDSDISENEPETGEQFLQLVQNEKARMFALATQAGKYMNDYSKKLDEEMLGVLRVAKGKATLLSNQKLEQFEGLCHQNLNNEAKLPVMISDLRGFWDMVKMQIDDIDEMFKKINDWNNNNWRKPKSKARLSRKM